jgi:hypothetical protein
MMLGPIAHVAATADLAASGIDLDIAMATRHESGALSALTASMTAQSPRTASVATDEGLLEFPSGFHHPPYVVWTPADGEPRRLETSEPVLGTGLGNEASHVQDCLRDGLSESPLVPRSQTLELLAVMDDVRRQIGVRYAADGAGAPTGG